jgi:hypothetical protein
MINQSRASQPDRVLWVLEVLAAGPHFRFREDRDFSSGN